MIGFTILLIGIVMIALPGPAILVIPLGLTILATEFVWARIVLKKFKDTADQIAAPRRIREFFLRIKLKVQQKLSPLFKKPEGETE